MVSEVKAFAAFDGKIFATRELAEDHDMHEHLKVLGIFNEATILAILKNHATVLSILNGTYGLPTENLHAEHA